MARQAAGYRANPDLRADDRYISLMPITVTIKDEPAAGRVAATMSPAWAGERAAGRGLARARACQEAARQGMTPAGLVIPPGAER
jgi:hypothetical protein